MSDEVLGIEMEDVAPVKNLTIFQTMASCKESKEESPSSMRVFTLAIEVIKSPQPRGRDGRPLSRHPLIVKMVEEFFADHGHADVALTFCFKNGDESCQMIFCLDRPTFISSENKGNEIHITLKAWSCSVKANQVYSTKSVQAKMQRGDKVAPNSELHWAGGGKEWRDITALGPFNKDQGAMPQYDPLTDIPDGIGTGKRKTDELKRQV